MIEKRAFLTFRVTFFKQAMGKGKKKEAASTSKEAMSGSLADLLLGTGEAGIDAKAASLFDASTAVKLQRTSRPSEEPPKPKRKREEEAAQGTKKGKVRPARPLKSEKEASRLVVATAPLPVQDKRGKQPPPAATASQSAQEDQQEGSTTQKAKKKNKEDKKMKKKDDKAEEKVAGGKQEQPSAPVSKAVKKQGGSPAKKEKRRAKTVEKDEDEEEEEEEKEEEEEEEEEEGPVEEPVEEDGDEVPGDVAQWEPPHAADSEKDDRTIFVGNLPVTTTKAQVVNLFKSAGEIESVRLRSMALQGTKVDQHGNQALVKKVSANKKLFATEVKDTCNAYVVFKSDYAIEPAMKLNGTIYHDKHLRVDHLGRDTSKDYQRSLFLGNLPFDVADEEVREHFAAILEAGHEAIESVRIVRDPETQAGKGFGFLLLKDKAVLAEVIRAGDQVLKGRQIRVTTCGRRMKKTGGGKYGPAHTPRASFEGRRSVDAVARRKKKSLDGKKKGKGGGGGGKAMPGVRLKKRSGPPGGGGPAGHKPHKKGKKPGLPKGPRKPKGPKGGPSKGKVKKGRK